MGEKKRGKVMLVKKERKSGVKKVVFSPHSFNKVKAILIISEGNSTPIDFLLFVFLLLRFQYMLERGKKR